MGGTHGHVTRIESAAGRASCHRQLAPLPDATSKTTMSIVQVQLALSQTEVRHPQHPMRNLIAPQSTAAGHRAARDGAHLRVADDAVEVR